MKSPGLAAAGIDSAAGDELQLLLDRRDLTALIGGVSPRKGGKMTQVACIAGGAESAEHVSGRLDGHAGAYNTRYIHNRL